MKILYSYHTVRDFDDNSMFAIWVWIVAFYTVDQEQVCFSFTQEIGDLSVIVKDHAVTVCSVCICKFW